MKSDDLKRVELRLQTADGLLRRNISTTREYWVTYVPVVVNMTASSPEEQMLYYYSAPVHVVPPQQYSVHPTGFNTCYTLLLDLLPQQMIVVRDPNQDNKDIMEEIISEAGRSRKPTLPVGNVFSVPMPLQPEHRAYGYTTLRTLISSDLEAANKLNTSHQTSQSRNQIDLFHPLQKKHISDSTNSLEENIEKTYKMEKASISQQELQAIKSLMLLSNTHKNVSVENQLLALKEVNTRQNLEIRGLKCKISSMEKSFRLMEEKLYKVENELNKDPKPTAMRTGSDMSPPRKAQKPRLDAASADPVNTTHTTQSLISSALETLQKSCSDVLPTDRIHALLTGTSELPVLRDEEKHVISEFCVNESLAETFLSVILEKIKVERGFMGHDLLQSLCRVYVGVCQQRGDSHKAHALAYRLLKEDFLEAPKVIMVMVTAWPSFLSYESSLCRAIHIVSNLRAKERYFTCSPSICTGMRSLQETSTMLSPAP
ncbi:hypothetical protein HF521_016933 [Silurus meridionalis]|uniref:Uncharacterized protein n=1 Tax=Silurus meridionalis TaxID=175797 RepID=A0A8T0BR50_SILME|nr:hypothetical protein HF521_016933 [Silurus meridionalis]